MMPADGIDKLRAEVVALLNSSLNLFHFIFQNY